MILRLDNTINLIPHTFYPANFCTPGESKTSVFVQINLYRHKQWGSPPEWSSQCCCLSLCSGLFYYPKVCALILHAATRALYWFHINRAPCDNSSGCMCIIHVYVYVCVCVCVCIYSSELIPRVLIIVSCSRVVLRTPLLAATFFKPSSRADLIAAREECMRLSDDCSTGLFLLFFPFDPEHFSFNLFVVIYVFSPSHSSLSRWYSMLI